MSFTKYLKVKERLILVMELYLIELVIGRCTAYKQV
jgi:hypothetical protein